MQRRPRSHLDTLRTNRGNSPRLPSGSWGCGRAKSACTARLFLQTQLLRQKSTVIGFVKGIGLFPRRDFLPRELAHE